jgi:TPR repeat protein
MYKMIRRIRYSYILWLLVLIPLGSIAADKDKLDEAVKAVETEDFMTAYQLLKGLAEQGNAEAQHNLAILYRQGKGVMRDPEVAAQWFQKAADQGLASAQYYLGHLYDVGEGVEKNSQLAVQWYKKAAEQGEPMAQTNLGVAYAQGEGTKQDIILAYVWFSLAAAQGLTAALENRNLLKQDMSEQLVQNAQRLTRDYFNRYVAPFQPQTNKLVESGHSPGSNVHETMDPPRPPNAPAVGPHISYPHGTPSNRPQD